MPEPTQTVAGQKFRPDAYIAITYKGKEHRYFLEVDLGTEWRDKIIGKVKAYEQIKGCPPVVFIAPNAARIKQLKEWIDPLKKVVNFKYCTKKGLIKTLRRL